MTRSTGVLLTAAILVLGLGLVSIGPRFMGRYGVEPTSSVTLGQAIYAERCAGCHGADLAGQPNWKSPLPTGRMPAPPHDASGHTWHHPDGVLLRITKEGPAAIVGGSYESDMPGFADLLADDEIRAVLAFIKSTWPERERRYQAEMSRRERENTR